jgi:predicted acyl esterase
MMIYTKNILIKQKFFLVAVLLTFNINCTLPYDLIKSDFNIILKDGTKIECTSFTPEMQKPDNGFPCLVYCHGFGKSKEDIIPSAESFARNGIYTFTYSMRGQGNSGGYSNLISRTEMYDLMEIIAKLKEDENIDGNNIAITGASQGGIIPFMACCYGLDVKCIVADLTSPEFASNWIDNGCVKMSLLWSLSYENNIVRYSPAIKTYRNWILSNKKDKWDSIKLYLPENRDFTKEVSNNTVPSYFSNSWDDNFFNANGLIKSSPDFKNDYNLYFGTVMGHGSAFFDGEDKYHNESITEWLNKYILNTGTQYDFPKYVFAYSSVPVVNTAWSYYQYNSGISPFQTTTPLNFYFHPQNKLSEQPYDKGNESVVLENKVIDSTLTMNEAVNFEFTGDNFTKRFLKNEIYFDSEPLEFNYNMLGIPALHLVYSSDADVCQFNFQIWEVCTDGITKFVSSINYTDRKYTPNKIKEADIEGNATGHIFSEGNKIRIVITNLDSRYGDYFLRTNPFVLPVLKKARNLIYLGYLKGTYLQIPLKENN